MRDPIDSDFSLWEAENDALEAEAEELDMDLLSLAITPDGKGLDRAPSFEEESVEWYEDLIAREQEIKQQRRAA